MWTVNSGTLNSIPFALLLLPCVFASCGVGSMDVPVEFQDECRLGTHDCDAAFETCEATDSGWSCHDIDECSSDTHDCHAQFEACLNELGTGWSCQDIDECGAGSHDCNPNTHVCQNGVGTGWVCAPDSGGGSDTVVGEQTTALGVCPRIPSTFSNTHLVSSKAEFDTAYAIAAGGDAIVFADGAYGAIDFGPLTRDFSESEPLHIIAETLHGVTTGSNRWYWDVRGDHTVVAGFKGFIQFNASGHAIRIACHDADGQDLAPTTPDEFVRIAFATNVEVDNNKYTGFPWGIQYFAGSSGHHIHHNTGTTGHRIGDCCESIGSITGLGEDAGVQYTDTIIEYNYIHNWGSDSEVVGFKTSRNVFRYNCIIMENTGMVSERSGHKNMYYGNWISAAGWGGIRSGEDDFVAFNFFQMRNPPGYAAIRLLGDWQNTDGSSPNAQADRMQVLYNVWGGHQTLVRNAVEQNSSSVYVDDANDMKIQGNRVYNDSNVTLYSDDTGEMSETEFISQNTFMDNEHVAQALPNATTCFEGGLFDGPGESVTVPEGLLHAGIVAKPSWWD